MIRDFEQTLVGGKAHWIRFFVHEPTFSRLIVWLTDNVDSRNATRKIEFIDVEHFGITWTDRADDCLEGLLGAHEEEVAGLFRYVLVTEQREIVVTTRRRAVL